MGFEPVISSEASPKGKALTAPPSKGTYCLIGRVATRSLDSGGRGPERCMLSYTEYPAAPGVTEKVSEPPTPPTFHTTKCQEVMENSRQAKNRESAERSRGDKRQRLGDDECKRQNAAAEKARRKK